MMKNGVHFIVIAFLVTELFKILIYVKYIHEIIHICTAVVDEIEQ